MKISRELVHERKASWTVTAAKVQEHYYGALRDTFEFTKDLCHPPEGERLHSRLLYDMTEIYWEGTSAAEYRSYVMYMSSVLRNALRR